MSVWRRWSVITGPKLTTAVVLEIFFNIITNGYINPFM